jgi:hypothetical protein
MAFLDAAYAGHDLSGGAVAALEALVLDESGLERVQLIAFGESLDGGDLGAFMHHGKRQAGIHPSAVDQHSARPAGALVAALLRAGEVEPFAQHVKQRLSRVVIKRMGPTIDRHMNADHRMKNLRCVSKSPLVP